MRWKSIAIVVGILLGYSSAQSLACTFTPLEWQQPVDQHINDNQVGQRKHTTWIRDQNRNFIDDEIEVRFQPEEVVDVIIDLNTCLTPPEIQRLLAGFGRISYINKTISSVFLEGVQVKALEEVASLPQVAMIEWQEPQQIMNDVGTRANQSRTSATFSPNTAEDAGFTGAGVTIAILDTGVDNNHQAFTGKFVAGFNAANFTDTNGNQIDDSCEVAPLGNGVCTDPDDEPGDGTTDPADNQGHGSHVAGIALGAGVPSTVCSTPDDGSPTDCSGTAPGANLVDIRVCTGRFCPVVNQSEGLDWLAINAGTFDIQVANLSLGGCLNDDGTSAQAQQVNYLTAIGVVVVVAHGNASNCGVSPGTQIVGSPGSASFAITTAATNDRDTVPRTDETNYSSFMRGPRNDFNLITPNLLALKPDLAAPGENILSAERLTTSGYSDKSGTSMAAPNVAGASAIVREARPDIQPGSLKALLKENADTSMNNPQFAMVDPVWDNDLGSGMLNLFQAVNAATASDPGFPSCVGPPASPGQPCELTAPLPSWNNTLDLATVAPPQVGVANTITAQVRNNGNVPVTALVNFGVYIFGAGNTQFFHIGTRSVTVPPLTTVSVSQPWTPAAENHQCIQVSIDYGPDTNYTNNVTQRNLEVAASEYEVRVSNPFFKKTHFELEARSDRDGWQCKIDGEAFDLDPFMDCPRTLKVRFDAPEDARPGELANCDVGVFATPEGGERQLIGGVTVQTFKPGPCRLIGSIVGPDGVGIEEAALSLEPTESRPGREDVSAVTDEDGVFSMRFLSGVLYRVKVDGGSHGSGELVLRPSCGIGALKLVLTRDGLRQVQQRDARLIDRLD